jgi:hypothetical protein
MIKDCYALVTQPTVLGMGVDVLDAVLAPVTTRNTERGALFTLAGRFIIPDPWLAG